MLYLFSDESGNPTDNIWAIGVLIVYNPEKEASKLREIRGRYNYLNKELKYSSTDYSQILPAIRCLDYFMSSNMAFKIIIKDRKYFSLSYYTNNTYDIPARDLAYISSYNDIVNSIRAKSKEKKLFFDNNQFVKTNSLVEFLLKKDKQLIEANPVDSKGKDNESEYTDYALLVQFADWLTGTILSICKAEYNEEEKISKNIYRKEIIISFPKLKEKLLDKKHFYFPSFSVQKVNVFYWQKNAL